MAPEGYKSHRDKAGCASLQGAAEDRAGLLMPGRAAQ